MKASTSARPWVAITTNYVIYIVSYSTVLTGAGAGKNGGKADSESHYKKCCFNSIYHLFALGRQAPSLIRREDFRPCLFSILSTWSRVHGTRGASSGCLNRPGMA